MVGKFNIALSFAVIYVYAGELMPTVVRSQVRKFFKTFLTSFFGWEIINSKYKSLSLDLLTTLSSVISVRVNQLPSLAWSYQLCLTTTHHLNNDLKYSGDGSFFICCWYRVADISLHQQSGEATLENRIKRLRKWGESDHIMTISTATMIESSQSARLSWPTSTAFRVQSYRMSSITMTAYITVLCSALSL